jgi:imidazolonepropionase-like amidohydrolase
MFRFSVNTHKTLVALVTAAFGLGLATSALAKPAKAVGSTVEYTVSIQGKLAGKQITTVKADGKIATEFTYRDNGRGPDIFEEITVGANGQMESFKATGKSTFGAPIDETFTRSGGNIKWKSKADAGEAGNAANGLYVPVESSLETVAIGVRSLLRAPGNRLPILPTGQLSLTKLAEMPVTSDRGKKAKATLYAMSGVSFEPNYVWMWSASKPTDAKLFGIVFPGFSVVEKGWEKNADTLLRKQLDADADTLRKMAAKYVHRHPGLTVVRNVRWFDSENAMMQGPADVFVHRGRIAAIYPANTPVAAPQLHPVRVVDGTGKTLLPGLFDMHGHTSPWDSVMHIAGGVTTLRDMGNINQALNELKSNIDAGNSVGPHIVPTGFIEGQSPHSASGGVTVKDLDEAKKAVDWYSQHGYRQIKLYNSMRPEWIAPLTAYARECGIRVSGHVPAFMRAEEAVRAGFDEIQHINQVMLNFLVKKEDDTRTLLRFYLVGDNANQIDLDGQPVNDFVKLLVDKKTTIDPTMTAFEAMFNQRQGAPNPSFKYVANNVPPTVRRAWLTNSMDVNDKNEAAFKKSYEKLLGLVKKMHNAGVPLVAGTDDVAGFTLHRELELYALAGIPARDVLKIATYNGAKYSQVLERTGTIAVGKDADMILVDGDPSVNISDIRRISMTMKAGAIHYPAEIYQAVGVTPFVAAPKVVMEGGPATQ